MLIYYFAPLYSKFIWNQLKDLGYFYLNYILTMGKYLFCNCASNDDKEGTSLYGKDQDENLCWMMIYLVFEYQKIYYKSISFAFSSSYNIVWAELQIIRLDF